MSNASTLVRHHKKASRVHAYSPNGGCKKVFEDRSPELLISGPAGTGKSRACLEKLNIQALKYPGMRGLILRKTAASLGSTAIVTWESKVVTELLATGRLGFFGGSTKEPPQYRYKNGSRVVLGGMNDPTKIMSSEYDVIYVQEAIELTVDDWEAATTRLRNGVLPYQQLIADTNPSSPIHWLKLRCDEGKTTMVESRHEDNPMLFNPDGTLTKFGEEYMSKLDALTGVRHLRLRKGLWVGADGVVYENFDPALHVIPSFPIPDHWTRWWSVDFGHTNPFVLQFWAEDPDGRLYLYREIYHSKRLVLDHARQVMGIVAPGTEWDEQGFVVKEGTWNEPKPRAIICDHDAEDRATLDRALGLPTSPAKKSVSDGIQAVETRWKNAGDGKPRLFIFKDALVERDPEMVNAKKPTCTAEEIPGYVWKKAKPGKADPDEPVKENDHGCDPLRYLVAERDLEGRPNVRWL